MAIVKGFSKGHFHADLAAVDTAGGVVSIANPEGKPVYVTRFLINVTTIATGACTLDAGIAAGATTLDDRLIDGCDAHVAGVYGNLVNPGANGLAGILWPAASFLTVSVASGASAGLVGQAVFEYWTL